VKWSLETFDGKVLTSGEAPVKAAPQASTLVCTLDFSNQITDDNLRKLIFIADLWQGDQLSPVKLRTLSNQAFIPDRSGYHRGPANSEWAINR